MLRPNFKEAPMAHLIAPRTAYNKAASGAAITVYRRPAHRTERAMRIAALLIGLACLGMMVVR